MSRELIRPPGTPPFMSQAVKVDRLVFVSGQVAVGPDGKVVGEGDIGAQARQCFRNIEAVLAEVGAGLGDIVKLTAFVASQDLAAGYLAVRQELFTTDPPASTTVVAPTIVPGLLVEIECVALVPEGTGTAEG